MPDSEVRYCIDTSSLVHAYQRSYPPDVLPRLWDEKLDSLIDTGRLISPVDVLEELKKKHDWLHGWAKSRPNMFVEIDQYEPQLGEIMASYPRLVDTKRGKSGADPMVIALALSQIPGCTVITEEAFGSDKSPRIPNVCQALRLPCINVLQLLRDQKWSF